MSYSIAGNDFSTYNMMVSSSIGALDFPGRLGEIDYDWGDDNGIEAYVSSEDLHWDGREIQLLVYYSGSNLYNDLATFRGLYEGADSTLVTTFGTHTVTLTGIKITQVFSPNGGTILVLRFWEPSVSVPEVPAATGGSGIKLEDYDLYKDFGLYVAKMSDLYDQKYTWRERTYGDQPKQASSVPDPRFASLLLNGRYSTISALTTKLGNLHAVLRTEGLKTLTYHGITADVYFADMAKVTCMGNILAVSVRLKLRLGEVVSPDYGRAIYMPKAGKIAFPGAGVILMPNGSN